MYNTQFKVKYNEIEEELIYKLKVNNSQEYEYSDQDVLDICNKLYRDELLSVFGAEDLLDDKIDKGMSYVYDIMITNEKFKEVINELITLYTDKFLKNEEYSSEKQESLRQLILISLFSQYLFHITHKCVCQQIEVGTIDNKLLVELRKHSVDLLKNQFAVN